MSSSSVAAAPVVRSSTWDGSEVDIDLIEFLRKTRRLPGAHLVRARTAPAGEISPAPEEEANAALQQELGEASTALRTKEEECGLDSPGLRAQFTVPDLRPGTLDSLLALSDDLVKSNIFIEGVSHKIRRQIEDLERAGGVEPGTLTVDGVPVDSYLTRFVWDKGKYPVNAPLKDLSTLTKLRMDDSKILEHWQMQISVLVGCYIYRRTEYALFQVRVAEYGNVKSQLGAINRKQTGSLAVRDLSNLIKPEDMVTSEHLVTLLSIVPKYSQKDWLSSYESLDTFVVPRSSKKLYEDNEYALYTVTLFAKVVDNFKVHAREKGFQCYS
ncbi:V-type proton ATPase subunit C-like [Triticum dicoccoides]|uniref:V-type proton ATPase subunit C-like n=1 Tax=Triticum dicoccoides TaxID=85692 RepID=UPI001891AB71|nr:V-type proton ATPase subunit C-like [Triticum dicoccoides]